MQKEKKMKLSFKKTHPKAVIPTRGTPRSAGLDLHVVLEEGEMTTTNGEEVNVFPSENGTLTVAIPPHTTLVVRTGLAVQPSKEGVALLIYPRSGLSTKSGIDLANCVAVIDSDYRGEMKLPLRNNSASPFFLKDGDRVAQLVVTPVFFAETEEVTELDATVRGEGGFGSTGTGVANAPQTT